MLSEGEDERAKQTINWMGFGIGLGVGLGMAIAQQQQQMVASQSRTPVKKLQDGKTSETKPR